MNKNIALIYMGGTFGCVGDPLVPMSAELFIPQLHTLYSENTHIQCFQAPSIKDSSACSAQDWLSLAQFIQNLMLQQFEHFVVIHGTDTLSYACATLSHLFGRSTSIVFTGSQYPLLNTQGLEVREFTDALDNLNFALNAVLNVKKGVYLAFHQRIIHARTAMKQHTTELQAFTGLNADIQIQNNSESHLIQAQDIKKSSAFNCLNIMMQPIEILQQIQNLKQILNNPPHFLILQGFGTGNLAVNDELIKLIDELYQKGCATVLTTQVPFGGTDQRYAIADWVKHSKVLLNDSYSHADLYAKALKMYLQYDSVEQWHRHWYE